MLQKSPQPPAATSHSLKRTEEGTLHRILVERLRKLQPPPPPHPQDHHGLEQLVSATCTGPPPPLPRPSWTGTTCLCHLYMTPPPPPPPHTHTTLPLTAQSLPWESGSSVRQESATDKQTSNSFFLFPLLQPSKMTEWSIFWQWPLQE